MQDFSNFKFIQTAEGGYIRNPKESNACIGFNELYERVTSSDRNVLTFRAFATSEATDEYPASVLFSYEGLFLSIDRSRINSNKADSIPMDELGRANFTPVFGTAQTDVIDTISTAKTASFLDSLNK